MNLKMMRNLSFRKGKFHNIKVMYNYHALAAQCLYITRLFMWIFYEKSLVNLTINIVKN